MNKILIDRAIVQQALEALQGIYIAPEHDHYINTWWPACRDSIPALKAALAEPDTCTWFQDGDSESGVYATSCRRYFDITEGTPEDNKMQWCCYCGKKLAQELIKEDEDE